MSQVSKYDEFLSKLDDYSAEFEQLNGRPLEKISELIEFLKKRKYRNKSKRKNLTSLRFLGK